MRALRVRRDLSLLLGVVIVGGTLLVAALAGVISPRSYVDQDLAKALLPPAWSPRGEVAYPLGTDQLGRDILSRLIYGARVSVAVGVCSVLLGGALGLVIGLLCGYFGGRLDRIVTRLMDVQLAFPGIFLAIAIMAAVGPTVTNMIVVLGLIGWVQYARVTRGQTMTLREREFVQGAHALGAGHARIVFRHVLPNVLWPVAVIGMVQMSAVIRVEAALSFLGIGVQPPMPAWGSMVNAARPVMSVAWWTAVFPGAAIALFVTGINLLGEGIRVRRAT